MVAQRKEHLLGWLFTGQHRSLIEFVVVFLFVCFIVISLRQGLIM